MNCVTEVKQVSAGLEINSYPDCLDQWTGSRGACMATGGCYSIYIQAQLSLNLKVCNKLTQRKQKGNYTSCLMSPDQQTAHNTKAQSVMIKAWAGSQQWVPWKPAATMRWGHWFHCSGVWKELESEQTAGESTDSVRLKRVRKICATWGLVEGKLYLHRTMFKKAVFPHLCIWTGSLYTLSKAVALTAAKQTWPTCSVVPTCLRINTYKSGVWNRGPVPWSSKSILSRCSSSETVGITPAYISRHSPLIPIIADQQFIKDTSKKCTRLARAITFSGIVTTAVTEFLWPMLSSCNPSKHRGSLNRP